MKSLQCWAKAFPQKLTGNLHISLEFYATSSWIIAYATSINVFMNNLKLQNEKKNSLLLQNLPLGTDRSITWNNELPCGKKIMKISWRWENNGEVEEWKLLSLLLELTILLFFLLTFAYLCTQTNYTLFVRYCSHYTIAESVVVLLLISIYPSHSVLAFRTLPFCFADSTDNVESAVECHDMTSNKDSIDSNCSSLKWKWKCIFFEERNSQKRVCVCDDIDAIEFKARGWKHVHWGALQIFASGCPFNLFIPKRSFQDLLNISSFSFSFGKQKKSFFALKRKPPSKFKVH